MSTISAPTTPQRVSTKNATLYDSENLVSPQSAKEFLDSSPISSKVYHRDNNPLTPVRTPLKYNDNRPSPSHFATSPLKQDSSPIAHSRPQSSTQSPTFITGSYSDKVTVGRCSAATYQVGRRNRLLSRIHLSISWNEMEHQFELTVLGLNGLKVDGKACAKDETVTLHNESKIDIVGELVHFQKPSSQDGQADDLSDFDIQTPTFSELSVNQSGLSSPEQHKSISISHSSKVLSERLLAVVAEVKQEQQDTVTEEDKPVEPSVQEIATSVIVKKEDDEQEDEKPKQKADADGAIETAEHDDQKLVHTSEAAHEPTEDLVAPQAAREESQEINIEVTETGEPETGNTEQEQNEALNADMNFAEMIIEALVFSRKSSMPISDIYARIMTTNPAYKNQSRKLWIDTISSVLQENEFFGQITRKGKTADGTPKENLYYYRSDKDPVEWRQATYTQVGRSARKCTLQDKQYFWKIPPKLGRNRSSYIPPPAGAADNKRGRSNAKQDEDEEASSKQMKKRKTSEEDVNDVKEAATD